MRRTYGVAVATVVAVVVALGLLVGVGPLVQPAAACSCVGFTDAQALDRSRAVFTGTLVETREDPLGGAGIPDARTTLVFAVSQVLKGQVSPRQDVLTSGSGASCGLELRAPGPYLLFVEPTTGPFRTSLCGGSRPLRAGEEAELAAVVRGSVPIDPLTPLSAPPVGQDRPADEPKGVDGPLVLLSAATLLGVLGFVMIVRRERQERRRQAGSQRSTGRPRDGGPPS